MPILVIQFLQVHFPDFAHTIIIRGGDRSWSYEGAGSRNGKQGHMASAVEELHQLDPNTEITKSTTLLIDDDRNNIKMALSDGVRATWLNPSKPYRLLKDLQQLT